jgi:hypothetical protein
MLLRVKLLLLAPKEDVVGKKQCRFKEEVIMKREVPPLVVHDSVQYHHNIKRLDLKFKRLDVKFKKMHLNFETRLMTMDKDNHMMFLNRDMEVVRAICPYYMIIISIGQLRSGKPEAVKTRYIVTTNLI